MLRIAPAILFSLCLSTIALAQNNHEPPLIYVPVDQGVDDVDLRQHSLRFMPAGLRHDGEQTSVFRAQVAPGQRLDPFSQPRLIKIAPGYRALIPHMDYAVLANPSPRKRLKPEDFALNRAPVRDGAFIELIPAGAVFDLRPIEFNIARLIEDFDPHTKAVESDPRIDMRLDMRIDGQRSVTDELSVTDNFSSQDDSTQTLDDPYLRTVREVNQQRRQRRALRKSTEPVQNPKSKVPSPEAEAAKPAPTVPVPHNEQRETPPDHAPDHAAENTRENAETRQTPVPRSY